MKQLIYLITFFFLAGCGTPQFVQHVPTAEEPHQVITQKQVPVEITATIPATEHYGQFIMEDNTTPETKEWDWDNATTTLTITPAVTEHGLRANKYDVKTTVKAQRITLRDTITVADTMELLVVRYPGIDSVFEVDLLRKDFLYTVTNDIEPCPGDDPTAPPPGSPWWKWLLYAVGLAALLIGVGKANRKSSIVNRKL